jgi:hypothetical protein
MVRFADIDEFCEIGSQIIRMENFDHRSKYHVRIFRSHFGIPPRRCARVWNLMLSKNLLPSKSHPKHLMWTFLFLFIYESENILARMCKCDEKTLRKWIWEFIPSIGCLNLVRSLFESVNAKLSFQIPYFMKDFVVVTDQLSKSVST